MHILNIKIILIFVFVYIVYCEEFIIFEQRKLKGKIECVLCKYFADYRYDFPKQMRSNEFCLLLCFCKNMAQLHFIFVALLRDKFHCFNLSTLSFVL